MLIGAPRVIGVRRRGLVQTVGSRTVKTGLGDACFRPLLSEALVFMQDMP